VRGEGPQLTPPHHDDRRGAHDRRDRRRYDGGGRYGDSWRSSPVFIPVPVPVYQEVYAERSVDDIDPNVWGYNPSSHNDLGYDRSIFKGKVKPWSRAWRQFSANAWLAKRTAQPKLFALPNYVNPYGTDFSYRPVSVGNYLDARYARPNFWIKDARLFGLPVDYAPYRWVRYYDDAVLVDMRSGQVLDVVYDVFW
jgi:Ni/Co efflux regulator RcnB